MAEVSEFHTNKDYEDLIPPLTTQEYSQLKDNIANNGQRIPIIVSNRTGQFVIVDGHHRYKIARELEREPRYEVRHFASEVEEIQFISDCNIEGRNLNAFQRAATVLKVKDKLTEIAKRNSQANLRQNQGLPSVKHLTVGRVNENLGKQAKSSHETIRMKKWTSRLS